MKNIAIFAPDRPFVIPYITAALPACGVWSLALPSGVLTAENKAADGTPEAVIMISSTDIYGPGAKDHADETAAVDPASKWCGYEKQVRAYAEAKGTGAMIIRCADLVCTGMQDFPRHLAQAIWRGTFFHFPGNEARRSVCHAVDLGRIARAVADGGLPAGQMPVYNLSDGTDPTIHDLAEALAFRMREKRISNLSTGPQRWFARLLYGKEKYARYTTSRTFDAARLALDLAFTPTVVTDYLRTHTYDENSL